MTSSGSAEISVLAEHLVDEAMDRMKREIRRHMHHGRTSPQPGHPTTPRILPKPHNRIDGVVITFIDIAGAKNLETPLRKQAGQEPHEEG
jgi:hypothetical protein